MARETIPIKKLNQIMKRFLDTKKDSDPRFSHYKVTEGLDYAATNEASACSILFKNKYFRPDIEVEYRSPGTGEAYDVVDNVEEFPNVEYLFNLDISHFRKVELPLEDIPDWIAVHDTFSKSKRLGGDYYCCKMNATTDYLQIIGYDNPLEINWSYNVSSEGTEDFVIELFYDFDLMANILKSIKDLKPNSIELYVSENEPIYIIGHTSDYSFNFALAQKLVR